MISTATISASYFAFYSPSNPSSTLIRTISGSTRMHGIISISVAGENTLQLTLFSSMFNTGNFASGVNAGNSTQGYLVYGQ